MIETCVHLSWKRLKTTQLWQTIVPKPLNQNLFVEHIFHLALVNKMHIGWFSQSEVLKIMAHLDYIDSLSLEEESSL